MRLVPLPGGPGVSCKPLMSDPVQNLSDVDMRSRFCASARLKDQDSAASFGGFELWSNTSTLPHGFSAILGASRRRCTASVSVWEVLDLNLLEDKLLPLLRKRRCQPQPSNLPSFVEQNDCGNLISALSHPPPLYKRQGTKI